MEGLVSHIISTREQVFGMLPCAIFIYYNLRKYSLGALKGFYLISRETNSHTKDKFYVEVTFMGLCEIYIKVKRGI
ncbi:hypothetical protein CACET_c38430 [Clostridium aceticum]|uniref:Uncharacterized protein n=1 Tax=Clostridium aceticum TaxID=84022 RepID=A0A0D8IAN8_9CLOT|nr:hypothetical protein CACET_c38430 [Clostridium aceticum]KJF26296.1 hypothetical protein TZ02_14070 [Clostridium aceticum]